MRKTLASLFLTTACLTGCAETHNQNSPSVQKAEVSDYYNFIVPEAAIQAFVKDYINSPHEIQKYYWGVIPGLETASSDGEKIANRYQEFFNLDKTTQNLINRAIRDLETIPSAQHIINKAIANEGNLHFIGNKNEDNSFASTTRNSNNQSKGIVVINGGMAYRGYECNNNTIIRFSLQRVILHELTHKAYPTWSEKDVIHHTNKTMNQFYNDCHRQDHGSIFIQTNGQWYIAPK